MAENSNIEWTDATWNPTTGCTKISPGCTNCYIENTPPFRMAGRKFVKGHIPLVLHEDRLQTPRKWTKGKRIFVNSLSDLFHEDVPDEFIDKVFDTIWQTPQHTYQVLTKRPERAAQYMRKRACRRSFGWTDLESTPLKPGDVLHLNDIRMRNQCGYVGEADWACDHPEHRGEEGTCDSRDCPIAYHANDRETLQKHEVADCYEFDSDGFADDCDWMELHSRPRHAQPGNLWLGFSASNQQMFEDGSRHFRALRFDNPYLTLFASCEPLLGPIQTQMKYYADSEDSDGLWSPLETQEFQHGSQRLRVPYLNWLIIGGESGPNRRDCDPRWISALVGQCQSAGVPCFVKQDSAAKPGQQGRIPLELWKHKDFPVPIGEQRR